MFTLKTKTLMPILLVAIALNTNLGVAEPKANHAPDSDPQPLDEQRKLNSTEQAIAQTLNNYSAGYGMKKPDLMGSSISNQDSFSAVEQGYLNTTWNGFVDGRLKQEMNAFESAEVNTKLVHVDIWGDSAYAVYKLYANGKVGERSISLQAMGTAVLVKENKTWRIRHLHISSPRRSK